MQLISWYFSIWGASNQVFILLMFLLCQCFYFSSLGPLALGLKMSKGLTTQYWSKILPVQYYLSSSGLGLPNWSRPFKIIFLGWSIIKRAGWDAGISRGWVGSAMTYLQPLGRGARRSAVTCQGGDGMTAADLQISLNNLTLRRRNQPSSSGSL